MMLRRAGADVERYYYDPSFHGVDLKTQLARSEQRLKAAATLADAFSIVSDFLRQFDDSHTVFLPPNTGRVVDYGWQMAMVGDRALITEVEPGSDAAAHGLSPGDRVLLLNGDTPSRANAAAARLLLPLHPAAGAPASRGAETGRIGGDFRRRVAAARPGGHRRRRRAVGAQRG